MLPQLILSSSAVRACHTAELAAAASGYRGEIRLLDNLYMAEGDEIISALHTVPSEIERVMVVGHNPGLESLIPLLTQQIISLPTAAVAYLVLPIDQWADLRTNTPAELIEVWLPKKVKAWTIPAQLRKS